jgi:hypothetical protein
MDIKIVGIRLMDYSDAAPAVIAHFDALVGPFRMTGGLLKVNEKGTVIAWPPAVRAKERNREIGITIPDHNFRREFSKAVRHAYRVMGGTRDGNGPTYGDVPEPAHPDWLARLSTSKG